MAVDQYLSCVSPTFAGGPNDERLAGEERGAGCNQGNISHDKFYQKAYFWSQILIWFPMLYHRLSMYRSLI